MRVLIACEESGVVRRAFAASGHDVCSCDLLPSEDDSLYHYQGDVFEFLEHSGDWDLVIAHPPCTYLTVAGNKWFKPEYKERFPDRQKQREQAIKFFMRFTELECTWAIENPVGVLNTQFRKPDQIIHPYQFGHPVSKATCLWLNGLPKLEATEEVEPEWYTPKGQGKRMSKTHVETGHLPKEERRKARSKTFQGIADAMAEQWGGAVK